jgi:hypothetical protein
MGVGGLQSLGMWYQKAAWVVEPLRPRNQAGGYQVGWCPSNPRNAASSHDGGPAEC